MINRKKFIAPSILIITEGASEAKYLQDYAQMKGLTNVKIQPCSGGSVVDSMRKKVHLLSKENDHVFLIYDQDCYRCIPEYTKLEKCKQEIARENVKFIANNPCFEYWLLVHFEATDKYFQNCGECKKKLEKNIPNYSKGNEYNYKAFVLPNIEAAIKYAKTSSSKERASDENPSYSDMYLLFDFLNRANG